MPTPNELVTESFAQAQSYAANATGQLTGFLQSLNAAVQNAPLVDITFVPIPPPGAANAPDYEPPDPYTSSLLDSIGSAITSRMVAGASGFATGLPALVEQAIWDRARERELATMQAKVDQVTRDSEALGFALPPGVLAEEIRRETRAYYDSAATLSRDAAIEAGKLEQSNLQKIMGDAVQFENVLADIRFKNVQPALEAYRSRISRFQAEVDQDKGLWDASIKQNEAIATYTINGQKINSEIIRANQSAVLDASKVGAQVYAQLASSAYSLIHASASVGASASMQVGYSYNNETADAPASVTSI